MPTIQLKGLSFGEVARHYGLAAEKVKEHAKVAWEQYVVPGTGGRGRNPLRFTEMPPPVLDRPKGNSRFQNGGRNTGATMPPPLNAELHKRLTEAGLLFSPRQNFMLKDNGWPEPPEDASRLSWAHYWADRGISVFPAMFVLGAPLASPVGPKADRLTKFTEWWSPTDDTINEPNDIACYPDDHGLFVVEVHRFFGDGEPEIDLSGNLLYSESAAGDRRYWFGGRCYSRLHALEHWVSVWGVGTPVALKPSAALGRVRAS